MSKYEVRIMKRGVSMFFSKTDNGKNVSYFSFFVGRNEIYYELCFSSTFLIFGKPGWNESLLMLPVDFALFSRSPVCLQRTMLAT